MRDPIPPAISWIGRGTELALRASAAPLLMALRWVGGEASPEAPPRQRPAPSRGLGFLAKSALDEIFYATELVSSALVPVGEGRRILAELEQALELYEAEGWLADPRAYHPQPPPLENARIERRSGPLLAHRHLRFESGYAPHPGEPGRERWLARSDNATAHAWLLEHRDRPRPWLVCVPAYRMGHPLVDFTGFRARWLHQHLGLNVAIPVMPLHGPRRMGWRGGDGFFSGDLLDTVHAQAQAVWDVRRLVTWLQDEGAVRVGLYGISLGGYTAALVAALEENLECVLAGIPATDFSRLFRDNVPSAVLGLARWAGIETERIAELLRVISPLAIPPRVPRERRYLYAGLGDRLATPDHSQDLWHHWEQPRTAWYQGSHVSFLWEREVKSLIREALKDTGLLSHRPPKP